MQLGCFGVELEINVVSREKARRKFVPPELVFPLPRDLYYSGLEVVKHVVGVTN
jgi:hypothetical protein